MAEVQVQAAGRGPDALGFRHRAVLVFEPVKLPPAVLLLAVVHVDVEHDDAVLDAGTQADVVGRVGFPPAPDAVQVAGGVLEAVWRGRGLLAFTAREYREGAAEPHRSFAQCAKRRARRGPGGAGGWFGGEGAA